MKKTILFATAIVVSLSFSAAYSQLKNMILIEEATNASCGPCASQNPSFEQFLQDNSDAVIGVSYHAWWPGATDPMYTNDKSMNQNRIQYYGFDQIGVPTCVVSGAYATETGGWYQGAPGDIDALTNAIAEKTPTQDISLDVKRYGFSADSERVDIALHTTPALTGGSLRVIVVEKEHEYTNAGNNGEKIFANIARKMLPSATGTSVTLAAGETKNFSFKYKYNTAWTKDLLNIIAFVQTNSDKAISAAVITTQQPLGVGPSDNNSTGFTMRVVGEPMSANQKVEYTLGAGQSMNVTFSLVDLLGRTVSTVSSGVVTPGTHSFDLNTQGIASGAYRVIAKTASGMSELPVLIGH